MLYGPYSMELTFVRTRPKMSRVRFYISFYAGFYVQREEKVTLLLNTNFTSLNTFKFYNRGFCIQTACSIDIDINVKTKCNKLALLWVQAQLCLP